MALLLLFWWLPQTFLFGSQFREFEAKGQTERFRIAALHDGVGNIRGNVPSVPSSPKSSNGATAQQAE
jgi:hypothetical protein